MIIYLINRGLCPIKGPSCFLEQEKLYTYCLVLRFQEQIWAWFHNQTKMNWGPYYGWLTYMSNKPLVKYHQKQNKQNDNNIKYIYSSFLDDFAQSNLSSTVSHRELQKWPLLTSCLCSDRQKPTYPFFTGQIKTLVDRKPLIAGDLWHTFDCFFILNIYMPNDGFIWPLFCHCLIYYLIELGW